MSILIVPSHEYKTIQSALDAAVGHDTIQILSGVYFESLSMSGKDNITITAKNQNVIIIGVGLFGVTTGFYLETNYSTISGITFSNFSQGITLFGNNNHIHSCMIQKNDDIGIGVSGNNNIIENCTVKNSAYGITSLSECCKESLFFNNRLVDNSECGISLTSTFQNDNVISNNTITHSSSGIYSSKGRVAIVHNVISNCDNAGIQAMDNGMIILLNSLINNQNGILLHSDYSIIAMNTINQGMSNGITLTGYLNAVISNDICGLGQIGLSIKGNNNIINSNVLRNNLLDEVINGSEELHKKYVFKEEFMWSEKVNDTIASKEFWGLLTAFDSPMEKFIKLEE